MDGEITNREKKNQESSFFLSYKSDTNDGVIDLFPLFEIREPLQGLPPNQVEAELLFQNRLETIWGSLSLSPSTDPGWLLQSYNSGNNMVYFPAVLSVSERLIEGTKMWNSADPRTQSCPTTRKRDISLRRNTSCSFLSYRKHLPSTRYTLCIAISADSLKLQSIPEKLLHQLIQNVDFVSLLAFDFSGASYSSIASHASNIYRNFSNELVTPFAVDDAITILVDRGLKSKKIVLGVPVFGHRFENTQGSG